MNADRKGLTCSFVVSVGGVQTSKIQGESVRRRRGVEQTAKMRFLISSHSARAAVFALPTCRRRPTVFRDCVRVNSPQENAQHNAEQYRRKADKYFY